MKTFQDELMNRPVPNAAASTTINEKYSDFVAYVHNSSEKIFISDNDGRKQKDWLTNEIMEIIDRKAQASLDWQNHRGTNLECQYRSKYNLLRSRSKKMIEMRQIEYWDEISIEIETAIKQHDPSTAYAMIRRLRGGRANVENFPIQDLHGKLLLNEQERLDR